MARKLKKPSRAQERQAALDAALAVNVPASCDVAVVGGGAAGLVAAIAAAEAGASVVVLERDLECGRKILATGNGRCNFANSDLSAEHYNDLDFVEAVCGAADSFTADVLGFFADSGLAWASEEGRLFPLSRQASSVREVLLARARRAGVILACAREVARIEPTAHGASGKSGAASASHAVPGGAERASASGLAAIEAEPASAPDVPALEAEQAPAPYAISSGAGRSPAESRNLGPSSCKEFQAEDSSRFKVSWANGSLRAASVILAVGGGEKLAASLGLVCAPFEPVLCPLACEPADGFDLAAADGRRAHVIARLLRGDREIARETGEVLFRGYGLSGIAAFNLSRRALPGDVISLDLTCGMVRADVECCVRAAGSLVGIVDPVIAQTLHGSLSMACDLRFIVRGKAQEALAQVARGGLLSNQFDPATLEARELSGLYAAGEAINVDADCGGYNLAWAWKSGMVAGEAAACSRWAIIEAPGN